jgi:hypothetical protein
VDEQDAQVLTRSRWHASASSPGHFYARRMTHVDGKSVGVYMHREIMKPPRGVLVDHISGDTLDNRRANLRLVTLTQNNQNRVPRRDHKRGSYKGVTWCRRQGIWMARIGAGGKYIFLGHFADEKEAAEAYDRAAPTHHGAFARLNFPVAK